MPENEDTMKPESGSDRLFSWALAAVIMMIGAIFLAGCATTPPQSPRPDEMSELEQIQPHKILAQLKQRRPPGPPPFKEQLSPLTKEVVRPPVLYSLVFNKAALGDVLSALTKDSEYNLSVESDIDLSRQVTVTLKNVTFDEALDMIVVNGAGYSWSFDEGNLAIRRFTEHIYQLDCLDLVTETDVDVGGDMLASGVENAGVTGKYQIKAKKPQTGSDLWLALDQALNGLKSADGLLRINRNSGVIYMADTPRKVAAMIRFLDSLSESLNRQVFVETRIMEVTLNNENKYGIDWTQVGWQFIPTHDYAPDVFELGFNGGGSIVKGETSRFEAMLDFLKTQGDVRVLSNPHIMVMNRQSALLTIGYQFPYTDIEGVDRDTETDVVTIGTSIRRAVLGLQLGLTAQISADDMVTFHIVPTLTRINREVNLEIPVGGLATPSISNPIIDLQELATTVRVRGGNSFILAGLISKIKKINHQGLPILGDLPLIGSLFKHMENVEENTELVILVTPYIQNGV